MIATLTMSPAVDLFATTEQFYYDSKTRCSMQNRAPGGGGINVARNLRRLGLETTAIYPAGGYHGDILTGLLRDVGQNCLHIPIQQETTQNIILTEQRTGQALHLVFPGASLTADEWQACLAAPMNLDPPPTWLVISGSLPPGVPETFFADVISRCHQKQIPVVLDTSAQPLAYALQQGVYLVKLNREDFAALGYQGAESPAERMPALAAMAAQGMADYMVLTLGPHGAILASRDGLRLHATPPKVTVVSHAGAGDAFVSVMTARLYQGHPVREAFVYGVAAAAAAISTPGNQLEDLDWLEEVRRGVQLAEL